MFCRLCKTSNHLLHSLSKATVLVIGIQNFSCIFHDSMLSIQHTLQVKFTAKIQHKLFTMSPTKRHYKCFLYIYVNIRQRDVDFSLVKCVCGECLDCSLQFSWQHFKEITCSTFNWTGNVLVGQTNLRSYKFVTSSGSAKSPK